MTEQERTDIAVLQNDVSYIKEKVDCLPQLCKDVERHDEHIKQLDWAVKWGFGVLGTVMTGTILTLVAMMIRGG